MQGEKEPYSTLFQKGKMTYYNAATSSRNIGQRGSNYIEVIGTPKTYGNLYPGVYSFDSLYKGYLQAKRQKRFHSDVLEFTSNLEENLITIQNELIWKTWKPAACRSFIVYEPKKRLITAPAFRDRVVHHSLVAVIDPLFNRKFIANSFACRKNKGTHAAQSCVLKNLRNMNRNGEKIWVLQTDISKYFASINHNILMSTISRTIRDKEVLWLTDQIIRESGFDRVGLPVGALTSQLFANIYLDQLDHYVVDEMGISPYIRYMDDTLTFSHSKSQLHNVYFSIKDFIENKLALKLNPKSRIYKASQGIDFCGYRTWAGFTLPRKRNVKRMRRRMKKLCLMCRSGNIETDNVRAAWESFMGYMKHCRSFKTRTKIYLELNMILMEDEVYGTTA